MKQNRVLSVIILFIVIVVIAGAFFIIRGLLNPPAKTTANTPVGILPLTPLSNSAVQLTVQAQPSAPLTAPGKVIQYIYNIQNLGTTPIPGIVTVSGADVTCPNVNTIGNLDSNLDPGEALTCASSYAITQADLDAGSISSVTTANVNGILSAPVTTQVPLVQNRFLTLTMTADPQTFDQVGQTITYTYVITNSGNVTLGPAQFTVSDTSLPAPINCGDANTTLAPTQAVTCTATHVITQADLDAGSVTNSATVSGGGSQASAPAGVTITKSNGAPSTTPTNTPPNLPINPANLTQGTTIQHKVVAGEWLWQLARCYGTDPKEVVQANTQLADPNEISPNTIVTVPNVGSKGPIYGPPCTATYTVQAGDTWSSIAQKYGADPIVMQRANPGGLIAGQVIIIPLHSAS